MENKKVLILMSRIPKKSKKRLDKRAWEKVDKNIYRISDCSFQVKMEVASMKISKVLDSLSEAQTFRDSHKVSAALDVHESAVFESRIKKRESKNYLVRNAIEDYRKDYSEKKKGSEVEGNRLNLLLRLPIALKPLYMVGKADVIALLNDIRSGKYQKIKGVPPRQCSDATAKRYWNLVRHIFEVCRTDYKKIDRTPFDDFGKSEIPKDGQHRDRRLRGDEYDRMLEELNGEARTIFILAVETAMRRQELLGIEWQDIDFDNRILNIQKSKTGARDVPLSTRAIATIKAIALRGIKGKVFFITPMALRYQWRKACKAIGATDLRLHDLRHESVSRAFESGKGLNVGEIKVLSGHKSLVSLERYSNLDVKKVAKKLG